MEINVYVTQKRQYIILAGGLFYLPVHLISDPDNWKNESLR